MDVAVVGAGYVGAVTAVCLAERGHDVVLVETAEARLREYQNGRVPFFEPGLSELFMSGLDHGRMRVTADMSSALKSTPVVLVCVGTPLSADGEADLAQVEAACKAIAEVASDHVIVMRSTLPIGTTERLAGWLNRRSLERVATNPEFLAQGTAVGDFLAPTRIVIGTQDGRPSVASAALDELYEGIDAPRIVTDFASAEMIKNVANGFLATKLSFINEVADLCEAYGADIEAVVAGIGLDPRIGSLYLRPGIGFGGSCIPKELANLVRLGKMRGLPMRMLGAAATANDERAGVLVERLGGVLGQFAGRTVALLGLSFKPDTDDTRYSPAISVARELLARGARVVAHDPAVPEGVSADVTGLERAGSVEEAVAGSDLVILATDWREYRGLNWATLGNTARSRVLFDGRNALDVPALQRAGWWVLRIGNAMQAPDLSGRADPAGTAETGWHH